MAAAESASTTAWVGSGHSEARLLALGPPAAGSERQAGVEIRLDPGYLTYWRQPGEAGLPPTFDTAASQNVAAVAVDFPAPRAFEEAGVPLFGYRQAVTFPLRVALADPTRPALLAVDLDYAVCAAICLPGKASLRLPLPTATDAQAAAVLAAARAAVPMPASLGGADVLAVESVAPWSATGTPALSVAVRSGALASLFVEGPEGWYFAAGAPQPRNGGLVFPVTVEGRPTQAADGPVDLRLTLVDGSRSIEVPVRVDAGALKP